MAAARRLSTAKAPLTVGIVGLGTAGAASALFLARRGHKVTIFEKTAQDQCNNAVGAGIGLQPIGLTVLKRLGILELIVSHGARIDGIQSVTETGTSVLDLAYADFRPELYGIGLHRDVLFTALHDASKAEPNVDIAYDCEVATVEMADADGATQNRVHATSGESHGPFDLLVVADGRRSIRAHTSARSFEYHYPFGCLWTILPDEARSFADKPLLTQVLSSGSAHEMLGFLPCGRTPGRPASDPPLVSLFWSVEVAQLDAVRAKGLDAWKARVLEMQPAAASLLEQVATWDELLPAAYSDTVMPTLYHGASAVFLGDCAHATSPQLGQGANLALVDAWQLAESVEACDGDARAAVRHYDDARRWRLRWYQLNSRALTPVFQSNSKVVGTLRDALMGPLCQFAPTRRLMLTTLCGAQRNGMPWATIPEEEFMGYVR